MEGVHSVANSTAQAGLRFMEIFVRLFVWILNLTYRRQDAPLYGANPVDQTVLLDFDESRKLEREAQRQSQIVENFKGTAEQVHGAVDYDELKWESYDKAVETPQQFVFYSGRSVQKIIAKSTFRNHQEVLTLRRVIRRHLQNCELRDE